MKVEEYQIGNTRVEIYDDAYIGRTEEEIKLILARIALIAR